MQSFRCGVCAGTALAAVLVLPGQGHAADAGPSPVVERYTLVELDGAAGDVAAYRRNGHVVRLYGQTLANGATPVASAAIFLERNSAWLDLERRDLVPSERHVQPLVWDRVAGTYGFTAVSFDQTRDGVPVFRARLVMLARNEPGHPIVLANPRTTRALGDFRVVQPAGEDPVPAAVATQYGPAARILSRRQVIFAGVEDEHRAPRLAEEVIVAPDDVDRWLLVVDRATGAVLFEEHRICFADVGGTVSGLATEGIGAEHCEEEVPTGLPYLNVFVDGMGTTTDGDGSYEVTTASGSVTVTASLADGAWFQVGNFQGPVASVTQMGTGLGPIDLLFNAANTEVERAQVNGYLYANNVRDFALLHNPDYPLIDPGDGFPVNVNRVDGFCPGNAWYEPGAQTINFCLSSGSFPNTSWSSVVYHEYGHHLVWAGTLGGPSGGAYGEGMSDTVSVVILDDPDMGLGFYGSCDSPLRDAENTIQYPCSGGGHQCGQLLSGCVWDTRNELVITEPDDYRAIIGSLVINSIPLHTGTGIDPSITIDFLTLDDDDDDIFNGTPHYHEINTGFGAHSMGGPELADIDLSLPSGQPEYIDPSGTTTIELQVLEVLSDLEPGSVRMLVDSGAGFEATTPADLGGGLFVAAFPASECGTQIAYYFTVRTIGGLDVFLPEEASLEPFIGLSALDEIVGVFDDFQTDQGWTAEDQSVASGGWQRGIPAGTGLDGDPTQDADGSGRCWTTGVAAFTDIDGGPSILTSPILDAGDMTDPAINYSRWFTNDDGPEDPDRLLVEISNDGGAEWVVLESVDADADDEEAWIAVRYRVADFVTPTDELRLRFTVSDQPNNSTTEAALDAVGFTEAVCPASAGDVDGDGDVDFADLLAVLAAWGDCPLPPVTCPADFDSSGRVDFADLLTLLAGWTG